MNNYYRLHGNGAYEALSREEYNHFINMQRRIFGGGYVLFLTIKGKAATVCVGMELVRELQRTPRYELPSQSDSADALAYRVFKRHNVYEYYANTGRADYEYYARNGKLVGAYNAAAQAWAPLAV